MEKQQDYSLYKYYKGEKENPFVNKDRSTPMTKEAINAAGWWDGEKMFHNNATSDPDFVKIAENSLRQAINDDDYTYEYLRDESISFKKRTLIFYLQRWSNKWFPYDDPNTFYTHYSR